MPNWSEILTEIQELSGKGVQNALDVVRRGHIKKLAEYTKRNTIVYYSGFLSLDQNTRGLAIGDEDMNGFMTTIHKMDRAKGLDLVLHTPGGDIAAAESIVAYLRSMFGTDIRAIVPQLAMSAGTMIACATKEIILGKQSSLGPFDPQMGGVSTPAVLDEFKRALQEIKDDPACIPLWQMIIGKYHPTYLDSCHRATVMSREMVKSWLISGMFKDDADKEEKAQKIVQSFSDHDAHKTHARHISLAHCEAVGLKVLRLEDDHTLQELVLSVHHSCIHTGGMAQAIKLIENDQGTCMMSRAAPAMPQMPFPFFPPAPGGALTAH